MLRRLALLQVLLAGRPVLAQWDKYEEVPYMPSPDWVVEEMLRLARVTRKDVVYDLGCGDGRIVIQAAKKYGARGVGIELRPELVREARKKALEAGVADRVSFRQEDIFYTDIREATVVVLFLLRPVLAGLRPRLLSELKPGARVVAHAFEIADWTPEKVLEKDGRKLFLWVVPGP